MEGIKEIIRENLVYLRKKNKLTQMELAEKIGYSDKTVSRWEVGDVTPDIEVIEKLAKLYDVPIVVIFEKHESISMLPETIKAQGVKKIFISLLVICVLWYIASLMFVYMVRLSVDRAWMVFIWACPLTFLLTAMFNKKWGHRILTYVFYSLLTWTTITAVYLQYIEYNMYMLFLSGIPLQIVIILWGYIKPQKTVDFDDL